MCCLPMVSQYHTELQVAADMLQYTNKAEKKKRTAS